MTIIERLNQAIRENAEARRKEEEAHSRLIGAKIASGNTRFEALGLLYNIKEFFNEDQREVIHQAIILGQLMVVEDELCDGSSTG